MPNLEPSQVYEMGNLIKLRERIDDDHRVTNFIRSNLAVIELMPVNYQLTLASINKTWGVQYTFDDAISDYHKVLNTYVGKGDMKPSMLRLWLTDDTVVSDNFTNNFNPNVIETGINSLSGLSNTFKTMQKLSKSVDSTLMSDIQTRVQPKVDAGIRTLNSALFGDGELAGEIENQALSVSNTVGEVIFKGKHVSLPKIWTSSTYSPTLTVTIKLVSPYGTPTAVGEFIVKPLMYLLALVSPKTKDGMSYGLSQPLYVNGYGITNMNLAAVQNITMRRGGRETSFNIYKQPLILDVMITIQPLADGFASVTDNPDVADFSDINTSGESSGTNSRTGPAITTLGNIIQSLRPAPDNIVGPVKKEQQRRANARPGKAISSAANAADYC